MSHEISRKIGFWAVFAFVTGSQIGSGVFMLPLSLAPFGALSLVGWCLSGLGALMLALVFAKLCAWFPKTGGPHVYVKESFGTTFSFFTGWTYWIISWVSTTVVISACVGYLSPLFGDLCSSMRLTLEIMLVLVMMGVNFQGVRTAGNVEFFLSLLKMIPLLVIPVAALFFFKTQNFAPITASGPLEITNVISHVTLLTLWGFIGVESATTPAGEVKNPQKTIPRAVVLGTLCVALFYFINSIGIMGALPYQELAHSKAPYADVTRFMFGGNWHLIVSLIAAIVCLGTLNAWILASGQIALGLAQDGLMPSFFAKKNRKGAPVNAILISTMGIIPLLILTHNVNLADQINHVIDYSVTAFLFVYVLCCCAFLRQLWKQNIKTPIAHWIFGILALAFCLWVIFATPLNTLMIAFAFVLSGVPVYLYRKKKFVQDEYASETLTY